MHRVEITKIFSHTFLAKICSESNVFTKDLISRHIFLSRFILSARGTRALIHLAFLCHHHVGPFPQICDIHYFYMSISVSRCQ